MFYFLFFSFCIELECIVSEIRITSFACLQSIIVGNALISSFFLDGSSSENFGYYSSVSKNHLGEY